MLSRRISRWVFVLQIQKPKIRMNTLGRFTSPILAALAIALFLQISTTKAEDSKRQDDRNTLRLIPVFNPPVSSFGGAVAPPLPVGVQLTFGGTVAHPDRPNTPIGTVGVQFVVTHSDFAGDEILGNGFINLPNGKISYQILLRRPVMPDSNGNINRISAITGGTGALSSGNGSRKRWK